ncbi:MAG: GIY-YIG nuclease family protein [Bacteroidia bacterium]|nr:GIY-YIG nuclease family protein [Bacteroidia bacterium]
MIRTIHDEPDPREQIGQCFIYILLCADGSYYTGSTIDLWRRLSQHQNGEGANHTKKRLPVELVYYEEYSRIDVAFKREKQIQGWSRAKKSALIHNNQHLLPMLADCRNASHHKNHEDD